MSDDFQTRAFQTIRAAGRVYRLWLPRLVTAAFLMVICVLAVFVWTAGRDLRGLESELLDLRAKGGHLIVADADKIYAVQIETDDPYEWAWRVHIPNNRTYRLSSYHGMMPATGTPHDESWRTIKGASYGGGYGTLAHGDYVLRIKLLQQPNGQWQTKIVFPNGWSSFGVAPANSWLSDRAWEVASDVPAGNQREFSGQGKMDLLRLRHESAVAEADPNRVTDSIVVWISPDK